MVVYERQRDFVLIEQNRHGILSGELAKHCRDTFLGTPEYQPDLLLAISQHDLAWVGLDAVPLWNDALMSPFSFIDLPSPLKLPHYQKGIDAVEKRSKYAALVCSHHYASFFLGSSKIEERAYLAQERNRQNRLQHVLEAPAEDIALHVQILKFFDSLSLYICLNEPGSPKESEFPWYREGFPKSEQLPGANGHRIQAYWLNEGEIGLTVFPFTSNFEVSVPLKVVGKASIYQQGIAKAYDGAEWVNRKVRFKPL